MEYLVTMTTKVPSGTPDTAVQQVREREARHSTELAGRGHLLRLWRPPLGPGEWRTLGLFAAAGEAELESVLASMPLRVWRSDQVAPLSPHPNDPRLASNAGRREFLTTFTVTFPGDASADDVADVQARETARVRELAERGSLARLWMLPPAAGSWRALGLWRASDADEVRALVASLPMDEWMSTEITALSEHPNDPALVAAGAVDQSNGSP